MQLACGMSDEAFTPGAGGPEVTREVTDMLREISVFGNDHQYMDRVACVESDNGLDPNTYREGYHGGVWQVDEIAFQDTQDTASHPGLENKYARIEMETGIDWSTVQYEDLRMPFYSGLAARIYTSNNPDPIPTTPQEQAVYWKENYNTAAGRGDPSNFPQNKRQTDSQAEYDKDINDFLDCPTCVCSKFNVHSYMLNYDSHLKSSQTCNVKARQ